MKIYEAARVDALRRLNILDTPASEAFDRITRMAARMFGLPISAVSLTDRNRQWFKSRVGVAHDTIPRHKAPCGEVADQREMLVVNDMLAHPCYRDSLLAQSGIRFYAGAPLTTREGYCLGAMCVLGTEPRAITEDERQALSDMAAMVMDQIELKHAMGRIDPMSGLPNRTQFIDDFRDLNLDSTKGERYQAVLVSVANAEQLSSAVRVMGGAYLDTLMGAAVRSFRTALPYAERMYQVSSSRFLMLAPPAVGETQLLRDLHAWLDDCGSWTGNRFLITPAAGVAAFATGAMEATDLLRLAQSATEDALAGGLGVSIYSHEQDVAYRRRFALVSDFPAALEDAGQLCLVFQPRVALSSSRCVSVEALLRWRHPVLGQVPPGEFMPLVEQTSMSREATAWVIDAALKQLAAWRRADIAVDMSINISAPNLLEPDFAERVQACMAHHGVRPEWVELEVTESGVVENLALAQTTLQALRSAGVSIAIDDFGTGYSSLAYLKDMPTNVIKIDQSFIRSMDQDRSKRALVSAMIGLSHELGFRVVAEGVETLEAQRFLYGARCDEAQGYLFARPLAPDDFVAWFRAAAARPA